MTEHQICFDHGAAYERMMGIWSRLAGKSFLDWLAPRAGLRWIDIGYGSGAFTQLTNGQQRTDFSFILIGTQISSPSIDSSFTALDFFNGTANAIGLASAYSCRAPPLQLIQRGHWIPLARRLHTFVV
jgi:hypothetical protein